MMPTMVPDIAEPDDGAAPEARIRLHVAADLAAPARELALDAGQAHYLAAVMRKEPGRRLRLFNGRDGEWLADLAALDRKSGRARLIRQVRRQADEPGPVLLFALLKRDALDLVVEKATELGAARLVPVITRRTVTRAPGPARLAAIVREAAEQSGRLTLPAIDPPQPLALVLAAWPAEAPLLLCHLGKDARPIAAALAGRGGGDAGGGAPPPAVLIGPEGGFAPSELDEILALPFVVPVSLGPLVLRAETAALAALACCRALARHPGDGAACS